MKSLDAINGSPSELLNFNPFLGRQLLPLGHHGRPSLGRHACGLAGVRVGGCGSGGGGQNRLLSRAAARLVPDWSKARSCGSAWPMPGPCLDRNVPPATSRIEPDPTYRAQPGGLRGGRWPATGRVLLTYGRLTAAVA